MEAVGRRSLKITAVWPPVNRAVWLQNLWLLTVFLLLCGFGFFAIPVWGLYVTVGRIALVVFLYILALRLMLHRGELDVRIKVGRYLLFFVLWLLWAVISLFWAGVTVNSARHVEAITVGTAMIALSLLFLSDERGARSLHRLWLIASGVFVGIAIWEVVTGTHLNGSGEANYVGIRWTYPSAVFWNPNDLATFLALALPFMFGWLTLPKGGTLGKGLVATLALASFWFVMLTGSRANIIACLAGAVLAVLLPGATGWRESIRGGVVGLLPRDNRRWQFIMVVLVMGGVLFLSMCSFFSSAIASHLELFGTLPRQVSSINAEDSSIMVRIDLVRNGFAFLGQTNYLGVGAGAFETWMTNRSVYYTGGIVNAHNWWLEMAVDYGLPIFGLLLIVYLGLLWNMFDIFRRSRDDMLKAVSLATLVALVEFPVAGTSSSGLIRNYAVWLLVTTALCTMNYHRVVQLGREEGHSRSDEKTRQGRNEGLMGSDVPPVNERSPLC